MSNLPDGKEIVLARICEALVASEATAPKVAVPPMSRPIIKPGVGLLNVLSDRLSDYQAEVHPTDEACLAEAIAKVCADEHLQHLLVPDGVPVHWLPKGVEILADQDLSPEALDTVDAVLTGCLCAIAETGTIVLQSGIRQGRRAITLVPDVHICVIMARDVVESVPEAIELIRKALSERRAPVTMISGPSATSDIELTRVEGVHGPRHLHVLISI